MIYSNACFLIVKWCQNFHVVKQSTAISLTLACTLFHWGTFVVLLSQIKASSFFFISYDESLNKILRNWQMDCTIRFWNNETGVVCLRYFDSKFLLRPNSNNLIEKLLESTKSLDLSKLLQLSLDGPNVNWDLLKLMSAHQGEKEHPNIISIGSCSLHIHGALQSGINSQDWELAKIFRTMYDLFKESPTRIDEYIWKFVNLILLPYRKSVYFRKDKLTDFILFDTYF